jgi:hypothetical protein
MFERRASVQRLENLYLARPGGIEYLHKVKKARVYTNRKQSVEQLRAKM